MLGVFGGGIGPIGPAGNGIVTIVQIPASPTLGQASTVQVTTTDGQVQSLQLPAGAQGVAGPRGPTGADGADGVSLTVLDEGINPISTVSLLPSSNNTRGVAPSIWTCARPEPSSLTTCLLYTSPSPRD